MVKTGFREIEYLNRKLTYLHTGAIIYAKELVGICQNLQIYGEHNMSVSYKKLWKLLIDKNMIKKQLREQAGLTTNVIAKLGKDENVSTEVLCKICKALDCGLEDIIEIIPDEEKQSNGK